MGKITVELNSLTTKMKQMTREMTDFDNVDMLRDVSEQTSRDLQDHIDGFRRRKDAVKRQVAQLSSKYDQKKAALVDNDTAKQLENLEQKMRHYEQNILYSAR